VQDRESGEISAAIRRHGGNKTHAAKTLGMTVRQLRYRIEKLAINP
jgi:transcriptional regulator with GAF, ATPase, and Fis domain